MAFGRLRLAIGPGAFIPRQRSLRLARAAARIAAAQPRPVVLEAFAGVAPIAATVAAAVPSAEVHAADVDATALRWARVNLPPDAGLHLTDGLKGLPEHLHWRLTLIAAVPPYVPEGESALIPRDLRAHEPARALYAGADGLDHVRAIIETAGEWLAPHGQVLLEVNRRQGPAATAEARRRGFAAAYRTGPDGQTATLVLRAAPARFLT